MKPIYCAESQNRIPPEFFRQGKAVWSGGKSYLKEHALTLKLKPDAAPPAEFAWVLTYEPPPAPPAPATPAKVEIVKEASDPAMSAIAGGPPGASTTVHGKTIPIKDPLVASTILPISAANKAVTPEAVAEKKPADAPVTPAPKKEEPPVAAKPAEVKPPAPAAPTPVKPPEVKPVAATPPAAAAAPAKPAAAPAAKKEPARALAEATLGYGEPISADELMKLPIFEGIAASKIERLPGAIVKRTFKKGDIVCHEGQYGSTAFYILSGSADVFINTPMSHAKSDKKDSSKGFLGLFHKFKTSLVGRKEDPREGESKTQYIPNDGPMDLPMGNPLAQMKAGDLFGEMSCMSFYPRSATVRANEDCVMLEMLRNVLQVLQQNKKFKEKIDKSYRERALGQHLRSVPILKDYIDDKIIDQLRYRVDLDSYDPGEAIIKQGDPSDAFYLIRMGSVKVSQKHPGGEIVLTYLGRGEYFGEVGLLKNVPRTATCTALDHVEVVKIKKADFEFILSTYDDLNAKLLKEADHRVASTKHMSEHAPSMPLDDFLGQGLMQAQNLLLLDLEKCTRCDECVRACSDSHDGVTRLVREGLRFDKFLVPTSCRSCMDPVCMIGCPVGSIRRKDSMEIIIEDWCIGCELCAKQCPYGNISMHPFDVQLPDPENPAVKKAAVKDKAVTCDLCTDLKEPSCVYACPHDAAHRVNAREFS